MKREDVVRLRKLLGVARGNISEWGGPYQTDDARSEILDALPALLALAETVMDAPEGRVYVIGTGDGDDLLTIDPRDRQDRETVRDMAGTRVRLVAAPDGE